MKRRAMAVSVVLAALGAAVAPAAFAHAGAHGPRMGEVLSVGTDSFELKTEKETLLITLTADTKFEKDGKPASRDLLKNGDRVGVDARKSEAGALEATRVVLGMKRPAK